MADGDRDEDMALAALLRFAGRQALTRATGFLRLVLDDLHVQIEEDAQLLRDTVKKASYALHPPPPPFRSTHSRTDLPDSS